MPVMWASLVRRYAGETIFGFEVKACLRVPMSHATDSASRRVQLRTKAPVRWRRRAAVRRPRALWVSTSLSTRGGIATFVRNMRQTDLWSQWDVRHIATHCNGSRTRRVAKFVGALPQFLVELMRRPSVIHIHTASRGSFARKSFLAWAAIIFRIPLVMHVHGARFHEFAAEAPKPIRAFIRSTLEHSDAVLALGNSWARELLEIAPASKVLVVPNAISTKPPVSQIPADSVRVTFLGAIGERKGAFVLLDAWAHLLTKCPTDPVRLTMAGDGEIKRARQLVDSLSLFETVTVHDWLSPTQVEALLDNTHILVLPSMNEGQPMAILEAMARGICVVASDVGGIPELLHGGSGVLVPCNDSLALADALRDVIEDSVKRAEVGRRARERVEKEYSLDRMSDRIDAIYRRVTASPQRSAHRRRLSCCARGPRV